MGDVTEEEEEEEEYEATDEDTVQRIPTSASPDSEDCRNLVSLESRYGMC
jgi:hypothetical protein